MASLSPPFLRLPLNVISEEFKELFYETISQGNASQLHKIFVQNTTQSHKKYYST